MAQPGAGECRGGSQSQTQHISTLVSCWAALFKADRFVWAFLPLVIHPEFTGGFQALWEIQITTRGSWQPYYPPKQCPKPCLPDTSTPTLPVRCRLFLSRLFSQALGNVQGHPEHNWGCQCFFPAMVP